MINNINNNNLEKRIEELEIQLAWQDNVLEDLNQLVIKMQDKLDLQQAQLRLLYQKIEHNQSYSHNNYNYHNNDDFDENLNPLANEIPPHY